MDKIAWMKFNDEYFVWAVVLAVVVFALVYSWNTSKEHFGTQCWAPETPMSAATGYPVPPAPQDFPNYINYVGDKLKAQGKCPASQTAMECANAYVTIGLGSLDMAKSYCSTSNCTAIMVQKGGPNGTVYFPSATALTQTVPTMPNGSPIPVSNLPSLILPVPCTPATPATPPVVAGSAHAKGALPAIIAQPGNPLANDSPFKLNDNVDGGSVLPPYTPASAAIAALTGPGDAYIRKSSLVPCTCTKHSMGCERHGGGKESSTVPGDKDGAFGDGKSDQFSAQDQNGLKRPFSKAFQEQGEPTGFLNSFSAFG
uniref:Uncharacterized protein n=1 Tax=viral metagenome TaxID=1070528 RepID=A0A6C0HKS3_9ZZZZ